MLRIFTLLIIGSFWATSVNAQEIFGTSDSLRLNFGYPSYKSHKEFQLIDENDNDHIDPGEASIISFTIENVGKYLAKDLYIQPVELNNIKGLELKESIFIGDINPGEERLIQVGVVASEDVETGTASFIFRIQENGEKERDVTIVYAVGVGKKD